MKWQEAVLKLKSSTGRISGNTMTLVATTIEHNMWWKQLLATYIKEIPSKQVWAPKINKHCVDLDALAFNVQACEIMLAITKDIHIVRECLRP
eukprot:3158267-Amphidinium_carterae.1